MTSIDISGVEIRRDVAGEIKPVSVSQSSTYDNNEARYGAHNAIDRNLHTFSYTAYQSDSGWFKARLDRDYCVREVVQYFYSGGYLYKNTYTCSKDTCTCAGDYYFCNKWSLSVYREDGIIPGPDVRSGCKVGNIVQIHSPENSVLWVNNLVIIPT